MCTSPALLRAHGSMGWPKPCAFPESCQYCTFLTEQNVQMLQRLSSARDSSRQFLSSVAECKSLLEAFDMVVNLRCSIRFVKPAKGGKAQVKAALSRMSLLAGSDFCFLWQVKDLFQCLFSFKKKKKQKKRKKSTDFSNQSHVIPKQIPPASAHAALFQNLQAIFCMHVFHHLYRSNNGK